MRPARLILVLFAVAGVAAVLWWLLAAADVSPWQQAVAWVLERQRLFHRGMAGELRALGDGAAAWGLVSLSFLYGIFHAAGPGHGKAVIATYLATNETQMRRGLALAAGASLCQGLVAIMLVHGLLLITGWVPVDSQSAANWAERASFVLLALLGALFAGRAAGNLVRAIRRPPEIRVSQHHHHHDDQCGCRHGPSAAQTSQAAGWRNTVYVLLAIGLRPCSGAILVLALANVLDLEWAGIGAVAAMSAGTAITVAVLALVVVKARHWAVGVLTRRGGGLAVAGQALALAGGLLILLMALSLLMASFGPAHPLRL